MPEIEQIEGNLELLDKCQKLIESMRESADVDLEKTPDRTNTTRVLIASGMQLLSTMVQGVFRMQVVQIAEIREIKAELDELRQSIQEDLLDA